MRLKLILSKNNSSACYLFIETGSEMKLAQNTQTTRFIDLHGQVLQYCMSLIIIIYKSAFIRVISMLIDFRYSLLFNYTIRQISFCFNGSLASASGCRNSLSVVESATSPAANTPAHWLQAFGLV